jgi:hypothetical protein
MTDEFGLFDFGRFACVANVVIFIMLFFEGTSICRDLNDLNCDS